MGFDKTHHIGSQTPGEMESSTAVLSVDRQCFVNEMLGMGEVLMFQKAMTWRCL